MKVRSRCAVVAAVVVLLVAQAAVFAQEDFYSLATKFKANLDKMESGRGKAVWRTYGKYFRSDEEEGRGFNAEFAFDGEKVRYDKTYNYERSGEKFAWDGKYAYRATVTESLTPRIVLDTDDRSNRGHMSGDVVRFKRMCEPVLTGMDILLISAELMERIDLDTITPEDLSEKVKGVDGFEEGGPTLEEIRAVRKAYDEQGLDMNPTAVEEADGTLKVSLKEFEGREHVFWFDPSQGYGLKKEQFFQGGKLLQEAQREFAKVGGAWVATKVSFKRYKTETDELDGWCEAEFSDLEMNVPIEANTFHALGFDFPAGTIVDDQVLGTRYDLYPKAEVVSEEEVKAENEAVEVEVEPETAVVVAEETEAAVEATAPTAGGVVRRWSLGLVGAAVVLLVVVVAVVLLIVLPGRGRRK